MSRHHGGWQPADPYATAGAQDNLELRCGLCDQPSKTPLCRKCARELVDERFGDWKALRTETRKSCGGCGYLLGHTTTCPVVRRG